MEFFDVVTTTRAIRRYTDDPVPEDVLAKILFAASRGPSGSNRQPYRFLVLRDGPKATEARRLIGEACRDIWTQKRAMDKYDEGSGAVAGSPKARMADTMQHYVDHFEEAPVVILACAVKWRGPEVTQGASIYPACQNILLSARALGYGGVLTIWQMLVQDQLREVLGIPEDVTLGGCITLGKPVGHHGPVRRRPLAELVYEEAWGSSPEWAVDPEGTEFTSAGPPVSTPPAGA